MNYHEIRHDDMLNGDGLRVVLFVSGCNHYCKSCQNPQTWDCNGGILFDKEAIDEIYNQLTNDYISGITFTGGDPLYASNLYEIKELILHIKEDFPDKTIWIYTGYTWEEIINSEELFNVAKMADVLVDGMFVEELKDIKYPWAGSTNQRVINVLKTISNKNKEVVLW